ncbi:MAG TPA: CxxxxCH/CxxCH domain-containing protein [Geomonas sp.]|nr:CxxxxCH/CxxCH domain-containing protein [Geomonas sp.]
MRIKPLFSKLITIPLALAALSACSGSSGSAPPVVDGSGKHPANWLQQHWVVYRQENGGSKAVSSSTACSECHGVDLDGGIAKVSCFSVSFNGMYCHANDDHTLGHPKSWGDPTGVSFHGATGVTYNGEQVKGSRNLAVSCGLCHATGSNTLLVGDAPSCLSTDPKWGISCHSSSPAVSSSGCVSCHNTPPDGGAAPNRAGAHSVHLALNGVTCASCHNGFGTGTEKHATALFGNHTTAYLQTAASYRAQTGTFAYLQGRCSGVSCHGGQQTPAWRGGSITVSTGCLNCHQQLDPQAPQYNSFFSGNYNGVNLHQYHLATGKPSTGSPIFCTDCHNMAKLTDASHFGALGTTVWETVPASTIGGGSTSITSYDAGSTTCYNSCHTLAPNPAHWN